MAKKRLDATFLKCLVYALKYLKEDSVHFAFGL